LKPVVCWKARNFDFPGELLRSSTTVSLVNLTMEAPHESTGDLEPIDSEIIHQLILRHLVQQCYADTAKSFLSSISVPTKLDLESIPYRRQIVQNIALGDVDYALSRLNASFPGLLDDNPDVRFSLYSQKFVELIRAKGCEEALVYAQQDLAGFGLKDSKYLEALQDVLALLAYEDAEKSPVGNLMSQQRRLDVANEVNALILRVQSAGEASSLETLLRHLILMQNVLNSDKKESWNISDYLRSFDPPAPSLEAVISSTSPSLTTTPSGKRKADSSFTDKEDIDASSEQSMEIVSGLGHAT